MGVQVLVRGATISDALWPAPAHLDDHRVGGAVVSYRLIPHGGDPRFLLPRSRGDALQVLRHFRSDGRRRTRVKIALLQALLPLTGGWPLARGRLVISAAAGESTETIESYVSTVLGTPVTLGVHLGPPRANRKPILQVLDDRGRPVAFGKVSVTPLTRRLVRAESEALRELATRRLPLVTLPRLLHHGDWNGNEVLLTSVLPLGSADSVVPAAALSAAMVTVATASGTVSERVGGSAWLADARRRASVLEQREIADRLLSTLDHLSGETHDWVFGAWHGDWTVWNMGFLDGRVLIWDWERFTIGVPVGWDALHFALRRQFETKAPTPAVAQQLLSAAPDLLSPFGVPAVQSVRIAQAYLVELALRYTADGQRAAGGRTARVEEWLLPVLPRAGDETTTVR